MRKFAFAFAVMTFAALPARAQEAPSLFEVFKRVCIDTGAQPQAFVAMSRNVAAMNVGGIKMLTWTFVERGRSFAATLRHVGRQDVCGLESDNGDDASVAQMRQWAGFDSHLIILGSLMFPFVQNGSVRKPAPQRSSVEMDAAARDGRYWMISATVRPDDPARLRQAKPVMAAFHVEAEASRR